MTKLLSALWGWSLLLSRARDDGRMWLWLYFNLFYFNICYNHIIYVIDMLFLYEDILVHSAIYFFFLFLSIYLNKCELKLQFCVLKWGKDCDTETSHFFFQKQAFVVSMLVASYKCFQVFSTTDLHPQTRSLGLWYWARILHMLRETGWRLFQAQKHNVCSPAASRDKKHTHKKKKPQHILIILKQRETKEKQTVSENSWHQFGQPLLDSCPERGPARHLMQKKGCCLVRPCVAQECWNRLFLGLFQLTQRWSGGWTTTVSAHQGALMRDGDGGHVAVAVRGTSAPQLSSHFIKSAASKRCPRRCPRQINY